MSFNEASEDSVFSFSSAFLCIFCTRGSVRMMTSEDDRPKVASRDDRPEVASRDDGPEVASGDDGPEEASGHD
jgi:hypothetical protein